MERIDFNDFYCEKTSVNCISVYKNNGDLLGVIQGTDPNEDWDLIKNGHNPIAEKWEDGNGHTLTLEGWN